ncbi:MAG TPA: LacI family transcriptional regulator [Firmicutes bacterium]|nr:LacI family transcriptional regulator [Bacillota bacterium]
MKKWTKIVLLLLVVTLVLSAVAFGAKYKKNPPWVIGFSQIGSESEWRTADTISIKDALSEDPNMSLVYADAQQKQENQIKALRSFIARKVDVIVFTALVETGYGPVLQEAQKAKIPVIMVDRDVAKEDQQYRLTIMGSNFLEEGRKAANWLADYLKKQGIDDGKKPVNIAELQGTVGSAPAIDRKKGFEEIMKGHPNWKITHSQTGNFTRAEGKPVMEAFLKADKDIQVLFAHNDDMALGAIQAIKEAGLKPGKDIIVVSMDGVKGIFEAIIAGEANCTVECNPLLGPQAVQAIYDYMEGKKLPAKIDTIEGIFDQTTAKEAFPTRQY